MAVSDLFFGLAGQGDPRDKLASALAYQRNPNPMTQAAWAKASGQPAGAPPVDATTGGSGGSVATAAPVAGAAGAGQQGGPQAPPPPPQPQAYTSPPDMVALYTELQKRGETASSLDRDFGLLASAFDRTPSGAQDITTTANAQAAADLSAYGPDFMKGAQDASDHMQTADIRQQGLAALPASRSSSGFRTRRR